MQQSSNQNSNEQRKNMQKLQWLRMSVQLIFVAILIGGLYKFVKPTFFVGGFAHLVQLRKYLAN